MNPSQILEKSIDFMKRHYEHLLPFALFYAFISIPGQFLPKSISLVLSVLLLPMSFSISYYIDKVEKDQAYSYNTFLEVYRYSGKYLGITIIRTFITLLFFVPFIISMLGILTQYDFDMNAVSKAMVENDLNISGSAKLSLFIGILLALLSSPFVLFVEYFAILDKYSISESFKKSIVAGRSNYGQLIIILIMSIAAAFIGLAACCIGIIGTLPIIYLLYYYSYRVVEPIQTLDEDRISSIGSFDLPD